MSYFFNLLDRFCIHCECKNLAEESIKSYRVKGTVFGKFAGDQEISEELIERYIIHMKHNTNSNDVSINTYLRAVRAILYYGMEKGEIKRFKIRLLRVEKPIKETYSSEDLKKLLINDGFKSMTELKIWAAENFLLSTGVRISTLMEIKWEDIDLDEKVCILKHTKNRRPQIIPISDSLVAIMHKYAEISQKMHKYAFSNTKGEKMDRRTLEDQISRYNRKRGVTITSAHAFRHTYAKLSVLNGVDVFRLQKLMGHQTLSVTREYVDLFAEDLRTSFNPLDTLKM